MTTTVDSGRPNVSEQVLKNGVEHVEIERLDEVLVETGGPRSLTVHLLRVAGHGTQMNLTGARQLPEPFRQSVSIHDRKADVQEREVRLDSTQTRIAAGPSCAFPTRYPFAARTRTSRSPASWLSSTTRIRMSCAPTDGLTSPALDSMPELGRLPP